MRDSIKNGGHLPQRVKGTPWSPFYRDDDAFHVIKRLHSKGGKGLKGGQALVIWAALTEPGRMRYCRGIAS